MTSADFRRIALGLPQATQGAHMGHPDFRVKNRMFATLHPDHPGVFAPESGAWGRAGCTSVRLDSVDEDTLGEAMALAWQNAVRKRAAPRRKAK